MSKLKSCPFCGSPVKISKFSNDNQRAIYDITCPLFCISMKRKSIQELTRNWNTRAGKATPGEWEKEFDKLPKSHHICSNDKRYSWVSDETAKRFIRSTIAAEVGKVLDEIEKGIAHLSNGTAKAVFDKINELRKGVR